jgi:threonine/homoserine/homoserine lactone efflux protein
VEFLLPLVNFAFVSSITPGPNNVMLSASGVAFGLKRTVPHLLGVSAGFATLLLVCGAGVGRLVAAFPAVQLALKVLGSAYLLYLAWNLRHAFTPQSAASASRPLRFVEAVLFQYVNPKAWIMALTAVSVFAPDVEPYWIAVGLVCAVFVLVGLPCIWTWAALGVGLRRLLRDGRWRTPISAALTLLLVYTVVVIWLS